MRRGTVIQQRGTVIQQRGTVIQQGERRGTVIQQRGTVIQQEENGYTAEENGYTAGERLYSKKTGKLSKFWALFQPQPVAPGIRTPLRRGGPYSSLHWLRLEYQAPCVTAVTARCLVFLTH